MAKKKSWFNLLKRLFISEGHSKPEKKEKRRGWMLGRLKIKRLASIAAPSPSRDTNLCEEEEEEEEEQGKHAAIATTAAAAEVVRLTANPQSAHQCTNESQGFSSTDIQTTAPQSTHQCERKIQDLAATKIQTTFRGYLARKALRALKGLVRLQAIIRGRAVRRQAITALKRLQSIVNIQSQICAKRCQTVEGTWHCHENKELQDLRDKEIKINSNSQRRWDDSILSEEEANALFLSKREAIFKRERIKEYALSYQKSTESEQNKLNGRWRYWLEQWVDTQLAKREEIKNSGTVFSAKARIREEFGGRQLKQRNSTKQYHIEGLESPISVPRRSFHHKKQHSIGDDNGFSSSPVVPTYMAATESAKAKARSISSPRLRPINIDSYSETNSPYKHKLSPISSINSEVTSSSRIGNPTGFQQRSPCLKVIPGTVKSNRTVKDLGFDSECSLPNWDRDGSFRRFTSRGKKFQ
ncbi:hypothetical protein F0562_013382 [Nyssa sinensis]|uniref:DUF4005 domain-containing protein n=1 Tax=Nyssa sinensis TaxID=561372 RepID=A0A5J4ZMV4_9ASTE|nr:hypothetical protein F0562_013382 [Nyssa sinensis]